MPRGQTKADGSPPDVRARPGNFDRRVNNTGVFADQHSLPSVDVAWDGGGDRGGAIRIHLDMRDFSGISFAADFDQVDGRCVLYIRANTTPIPDTWVGEGSHNLVEE